MQGKVVKMAKRLALGVSKMYEIENQLNFEDFVFPYGKLNPDNRWVKMASEIPWEKIEVLYAEKFSKKGNRAKNIRIALGSLIIKQILCCSDEETVLQVGENPYLQYFIGMKEYTHKAPFSSQSMTEFRKRFAEDDILDMINEIIIAEDRDDDDEGNSEEPRANSGTIAIDATCAPADITFPQDLKILNKAREHTEEMIDTLQKGRATKKPRTYKQKARKEFLKISKSKKRSKKHLRAGIRKQLGYLKRNLKTIDEMLKTGNLGERELERLQVIKQVFEQQLYMYENRTHSVSDRIVSISQPYVRPIPRGKANAKTEFGAKVEISIVNGFTRVETLSFDAYNEGSNLIRILENYKEKHGFHPERVLVDKLYRNRKNLNYCKERGIKITGPALGRPKKNAVIDKKAEYQDICDRNCVEGKFGEGKTTYGLGRIAARLKDTSISVIKLSFLVMNINKRMRILLSIFKNSYFRVDFDEKIIAF